MSGRAATNEVGPPGTTLTVGDGRSQRRLYLFVSLAVLAVTLLPFLSVTFAPLLDYPNHLARAYILEHIHSEAAFSNYYESAWALIPNLGMDAVFALLLPLLDIETTSMVFLVALVVASHLGAHVLAREMHGRASWLAPLASFFVFSYGLFLGFANYILGVAVFYFAFAAWLRHWRTGSLRSLLMASGLAVVAYLTHVSAFAVLVIAIIAGIVSRLRGSRHVRVLVALIPVVAPLVMHVASQTLVSSAGIKWDGPGETIRFLVRFLQTYNIGYDIAFVLTFFGALLVALKLGGARPHRRALIAGGAILACFAVAPTWWNGSWLAFRFLLPGAVVVFLAFEVDLAVRRVRWAYGVAVVTLAARAISVTLVWTGLDDRIGAYVQFMDSVPRGARVYPIFADMSEAGGHYGRSFRHICHYLAVYRHATAHGLFQGEGNQPIRSKPDVAPITVAPDWTVAPEYVDWSSLFAGYDAVWLHRPPEVYRTWLAAHCTSSASWDEVALYQGCAVPP